MVDGWIDRLDCIPAKTGSIFRTDIKPIVSSGSVHVHGHGKPVIGLG